MQLGLGQAKLDEDVQLDLAAEQHHHNLLMGPVGRYLSPVSPCHLSCELHTWLPQAPETSSFPHEVLFFLPSESMFWCPLLAKHLRNPKHSSHQCLEPAG